MTMLKFKMNSPLVQSYAPVIVTTLLKSELWLRHLLVTFFHTAIPFYYIPALSVCISLWRFPGYRFVPAPSFMHGGFGLRSQQGPWSTCHFIESCSTGSSWVCGNSTRITSSISFAWIGVFNQNTACTRGTPHFCHSTVNICEHDLRKTLIRQHTTKNFWERNSNYLLALLSECHDSPLEWRGLQVFP